MRLAGGVARMGENTFTHLSTPHNLRRCKSVVKYSNIHHNSRSFSHLIRTHTTHATDTASLNSRRADQYTAVHKILEAHTLTE